jgi:membrane protein required for colicin V production
MPVTILDMIVVGIVLISGLLAALRGFTREVLAIGSWAAAAAAAYLLHPQLVPLAQQYVSTNINIARPVAAGGVFLVTLLIAHFLTSKISDLILDSRIGALDRTLGFIFGAARGLLLAVVGFLFFNWLVADKQQPPWVKDAKLKPLLESTGASLMSLLPEDPERALKQLRSPRDGEAPRDAPAPTVAPSPTPPPRRSEAPAPTPAAAPASPTDRAALQRLIDGGQRPAQNR